MNLGLADVIQRHAQQRSGDIALHFEGQRFSYGQLWHCIQLATRILRDAGVQPGDRVACLSLNHPGVIVLLFALAQLGAILLPLNYRLAPAELAAVLDHAGASLIVADSIHQTLADELAAGKGIAMLPLYDFDKVNDADTASTFAHGTTNAPVLLVYTSGATGQPKGVLHTQAGLLANCQIAAQAQELTALDHVLTALPLFHVGGLCIQTLPALRVGARVTLHARFDAGAWLADVQRLRPSTSLMVPATMRAIMQHADFAHTDSRADLSSLKFLGAGSSSVPESLIAAFHARGVPICQIYGATETGPVSICLRRRDAMSHVGSTGQAGQGVDVRLVGTDGADVAPETVGEIWIRAPNVMSGYWPHVGDADNPAFRDGWFHSGDLALCDADGFYRVVGRSKDMIISGGENIYPAEIENILADCPQIQDAAAVGLPDATWGEVVVAVVVKQPHATLTEADVMALFDGRLARYKQPRRVVFCESLPKTALGKVQKAQLAAQVEKRLRA